MSGEVGEVARATSCKYQGLAGYLDFISGDTGSSWRVLSRMWF